MVNVSKVRKDFPMLKSGIVYLNSAATSLTPEPVLEAMLDYYRGFRSTVDRGLSALSQEASQAYQDARARVARFVRGRPDGMIFTKNSTEGINIVASGLGLKKGDKVVTTLLEHHSNLLPWMLLKERVGIKLEVVKPTREGLFDLRDFEKACRGAKVVAVTGMSNALGSLPRVAEMGEVAREDGLFLVDGAQLVPHFPVDVKKLGCDFLAFSGHKMLGPTGIGGLWVSEDGERVLKPSCLGGGTVEEVSLDSYELAEFPASFECGTPPVAGAIGLGAAVDYLESVGMDKVAGWDRVLVKATLKGLSGLSGVEVYGPRDLKKRGGVISFNVDGLDPHETALALDKAGGIVVRSGHLCALPLMKFLGVAGVVRASFYLYNTRKDVEVFLGTLEEVARRLR